MNAYASFKLTYLDFFIPGFYNPQEKIAACLERNRTQLAINLNRSQSAPLNKILTARPQTVSLFKLTRKDREVSNHTETDDDDDEKNKAASQANITGARHPQQTRPLTMTRPAPQIISILRPTMGARPMTQISIKRANNVKY